MYWFYLEKTTSKGQLLYPELSYLRGWKARQPGSEAGEINKLHHQYSLAIPAVLLLLKSDRLVPEILFPGLTPRNIFFHSKD